MSLATDESAIRETVNYYAEGMRTARVETLKQAFHTQAILCGYLGDELITKDCMNGLKRILRPIHTTARCWTSR